MPKGGVLLRASGLVGGAVSWQIKAVGQGFPPKNLVARAGIEPGTVRAGKGDAHAVLVTRFGNYATQSASGVKHLYPHVTGDERPPFLIDRKRTRLNSSHRTISY